MGATIVSDLSYRLIDAMLDRYESVVVSKLDSCVDETRADWSSQDTCVNGEMSAGMTTFSAHLQRIVPSRILQPSETLSQTEWDYFCAQELIGAYTNYFEYASARVSRSSSSYESDIRKLFVPGTVAYATLSRADFSPTRPIAPLLLLNDMLFQLCDCSEEESEYQYWAMKRKFRRCDVDLSSGPTYLLYALGMTPDMKAWTDVEQMSMVSRLLSVEVRLSHQTQLRLKSSLLSFVSAETAEVASDWWTPDALYAHLHGVLCLSGDESSLGKNMCQQA